MKKTISIILTLIVIASTMHGCSVNHSSQEDTTPSDISQKSMLPSYPEPTNTELSYGFLDHTMFSFYLTDGTNRCGDDFEPGEYYIMSIYGSGALYDVCNSPNDFSWSRQRVMRRVSVNDGQYVKLSDSILVRADEVDTSDWAKYGVFLVGKDLPAGDYKVVRITDSYHTELDNVSGIPGAYQICSRSPVKEPVSCGIIVDGQEYITLKIGQYLIINNVQLTLCGSKNSETTEEVSSQPTETQEIITTPEIPTVATEEELTLSSFIKCFKKLYIDEFDRTLSKPTEVEDSGTVMYRFAICNEDGLVLPCTINVICSENDVIDSVVVAYYENGDSSLIQQIVDVWA